MTLPASGPMTMGQIAFEVNVSSTGLSLNHSWVRTLAGLLSGPIGFANLQGKTGRLDGNFATDSNGADVILNNAPFFGSQLNTLEQVQGASPKVTLFIGEGSGVIWTGAITVYNNSSGQSARLVYTSGSPPGFSLWQAFGTFPGLVRPGATADSFTIVPTV